MRRDKVWELSLLTVLKENFVRQEVPTRDAVGGGPASVRLPTTPKER